MNGSHVESGQFTIENQRIINSLKHMLHLLPLALSKNERKNKRKKRSNSEPLNMARKIDSFHFFYFEAKMPCSMRTLHFTPWISFRYGFFSSLSLSSFFSHLHSCVLTAFHFSSIRFCMIFCSHSCSSSEVIK